MEEWCHVHRCPQEDTIDTTVSSGNAGAAGVGTTPLVSSANPWQIVFMHVGFDQLKRSYPLSVLSSGFSGAGSGVG